MPRRKTYQKGSLSFESGKMPTFRIREFDHQGGKWVMRRFQLGKFKDKTDAQRSANAIRAEINERNNTDPKKLYARLTFREFVERYWREYEVRENHQPSTLDSRQSFLQRHVLPAFGDKMLREIEPKDIGDFLHSLHVANYAPNTIKVLYIFLKALFSLAKQYDLISKSPVRPKRHRPKAAKVKKPTLTGEQIGKVIRQLPDRQEKLFALLVALTAMRKGEALALRWTDFNSEAGTVTINHTLYKNQLKKPKTEESVATLKLEKALVNLLRSHKRESAFQSPTDFIFCRGNGQPLSYESLLVHLREALDRVGIRREKMKHGFHLLRHSLATELYRKSRDVKDVQKILRHSNISTTGDIYIHHEAEISSEGIGSFAGEILPNCDLLVTEEIEMVS